MRARWRDAGSVDERDGEREDDLIPRVGRDTTSSASLSLPLSLSLSLSHPERSTSFRVRARVRGCAHRIVARPRRPSTICSMPRPRIRLRHRRTPYAIPRASASLRLSSAAPLRSLRHPSALWRASLTHQRIASLPPSCAAPLRSLRHPSHTARSTNAHVPRAAIPLITLSTSRSASACGARPLIISLKLMCTLSCSSRVPHPLSSSYRTLIASSLH